jgi:hypothetical protein
MSSKPPMSVFGPSLTDRSTQPMAGTGAQAVNKTLYGDSPGFEDQARTEVARQDY